MVHCQKKLLHYNIAWKRSFIGDCMDPEQKWTLHIIKAKFQANFQCFVRSLCKFRSTVIENGMRSGDFAQIWHVTSANVCSTEARTVQKKRNEELFQSRDGVINYNGCHFLKHVRLRNVSEGECECACNRGVLDMEDAMPCCPLLNIKSPENWSHCSLWERKTMLHICSEWDTERTLKLASSCR